MKTSAGRGQFLVEFVLSVGIWSALFAGMVFIGRVLLTRQRVHQVARYGTMLQSTGRLTESTVRAELNDFSSVMSRSASVDWTIETGRFLGTPSSKFYRLVRTRVTAGVPSSPQKVTDAVVGQMEGTAL